MRQRCGYGILNLVIFAALFGMAWIAVDLDIFGPSPEAKATYRKLRISKRPTLAVFGRET